jgi:hypothetical protein
MKKTFRFAATICFAAFTFASCSVQKEIYRKQEAKNPSLNATATGVVLKPIVADLDISKEKKTITYKADLNLDMSDLKPNATRVFLETHKCDYIIDPKFVRTATSSHGKVKEVEYILSGFAATYTKVYQVDSLPKSVIEYAKIQLPVERVDFSTLNERTSKGSSLGMEFAYGLTSFTAAQIDYAPVLTGLSYYVGLETNSFSNNYFDRKTVEFDYLVPSGSSTSRVGAVGAFSTMTNFSIGAFKEKEIGRRVKIRGGGGLNLLNIQFFEPTVDFARNYQFDGARSMGFRLSAAVDITIFPGFSLLGRAHSNIGLFKSIQQSGPNSADVENIQFQTIAPVNFSYGARFTF